MRINKSKVCRDLGITYDSVNHRMWRHGISFEEALDLVKRGVKTFGKRIEGLSSKEYCRKYGYKYEKEFYRHWHAIND